MKKHDVEMFNKNYLIYKKKHVMKNTYFYMTIRYSLDIKVNSKIPFSIPVLNLKK